MIAKTKFEKAIMLKPEFWKLVKRLLLAQLLTVAIASQNQFNCEQLRIKQARKGLNKRAKILKKKIDSQNK